MKRNTRKKPSWAVYRVVAFATLVVAAIIMCLQLYGGTTIVATSLTSYGIKNSIETSQSQVNTAESQVALFEGGARETYEKSLLEEAQQQLAEDQEKLEQLMSKKNPVIVWALVASEECLWFTIIAGISIGISVLSIAWIARKIIHRIFIRATTKNPT